MKYSFRCILCFLIIASSYHTLAQESFGYQTPPAVLSELLLAKPTPGVSIDVQAKWMLLIERNSYPTVNELGQPEARIAGMRINPSNFSPSRQTFINNFKLKNLPDNKVTQVKGLPLNMLAGQPVWNPAQTKIAFTNTTPGRVDLYVIDVRAQTAKKVNQRPLNTIMGGAFSWIDDNTLLYKTILQPASLAPTRPITPSGPAMQENMGKAAPIRTYQDLIRSPYDAQLFEFLATAQTTKDRLSPQS